MSAMMPYQAPVVRARPSSGLAEVLDIILDRGLVIDAFVRVSVVGIELLTVDARVVVASVDTYLRFAEVVDRLNIRAQTENESIGLDDIIRSGR
jgi:gas vesicle structural protein